MNAVFAAVEVNVASSAILGWLGQALLFGTALAGLTWLLTRLMRRRIHPSFEAALWLIVLLKFLLPVGPASSLSLASVCETLSRYAPAGLMATDPTDVDTTGRAAATAGGRAYLDTAATLRSSPWAILLTAAYLAGVVVLLVVRTRSYQALVARCRDLPLADEATERLVHNICRRLGVHRRPSVRVSEESAAPYVMGFFRPLLVLSHRQLARPDELEAVIVHEVTHLRRGDLFVRYLQWITGTLLFFWPVVAWVNRRIDRAREYVCDEGALRHGTLTAGEYARCLLNAMQPTRFHRLVYQPAYMAGGYANIERRIEMILESPGRSSRRPVWGLLTIGFLLVWGGFALTGTADATRAGETKDPGWATGKQGVKERVNEVIGRISQYPAADVDGSGETSRPERTAFVITAVRQFPGEVIAEFPYADGNQDGILDFRENYDFVRGNTLAAIERKQAKLAYQAALAERGEGSEQVRAAEQELKRLKVEVTHMVLDGVEWVLDEMPGAPAADQVAAVSEKVAHLEAKLFAKDRGKKVAGLQHKIQELRTKAGQLEGDEAAKYEAKAAELEAKLAEFEAKKTGKP